MAASAVELPPSFRSRGFIKSGPKALLGFNIFQHRFRLSEYHEVGYPDEWRARKNCPRIVENGLHRKDVIKFIRLVYNVLFIIF
jgi:hypothetical protein